MRNCWPVAFTAVTALPSFHPEIKSKAKSERGATVLQHMANMSEVQDRIMVPDLATSCVLRVGHNCEPPVLSTLSQ